MFDWFKKESRATEAEVLADIAEGFTPSTTTAKTRADALSIPAVASAVDWISGVIASLPIRMYKKTDSGYQEVFNDYRIDLVNQYSGNNMLASDLFKNIITDYLLDGNGFAYVVKRGNKIEKLSYIPPTKLTYTESVDCINKVLKVWVDSREIRDYDLFRIARNTQNSLIGFGFVSDNQLLISTILNSLDYENKTTSSGVRRGFLKSKFKLDKDKLKSLKEAWRKLRNRDSDVLVLNEGIEFENATSTATESQLSQNKEINTRAVLTYFGLPSNFLTNANSDSYKTAIRIAVLPIVNLLENALNQYLLLESEKNSLKFVIDTSGILENSMNERFDAYQKALSSGFLTIDEIRRKENMEVLNMPYLKLGLGDVLYRITDGSIFVPNTNSVLSKDDLSSNTINTDNVVENGKD